MAPASRNVLQEGSTYRHEAGLRSWHDAAPKVSFRDSFIDRVALGYGRDPPGLLDRMNVCSVRSRFDSRHSISGQCCRGMNGRFAFGLSETRQPPFHPSRSPLPIRHFPKADIASAEWKVAAAPQAGALRGWARDSDPQARRRKYTNQ